jgi:hypothetical protein
MGRKQLYYIFTANINPSRIGMIEQSASES